MVESRGRRKLIAAAVVLAGWLVLGVGLALASEPPNRLPPAGEFIWPISGGGAPDLPQSSTYGPRLKAGDGFRYDYHQGIDIPASIGTPVLAVLTGTVRIAGAHPLYQDGVVQLDHGNGLYSNYIHITASLVTTGQLVGRGDPLASSWISASGFPHLHFEIRDGSVWRRDTVHPWGYLPYTDTVRHTAEITEVLPSNAAWVRATVPADELDIVAISVTVQETATGVVFSPRVFDYEMRNKHYNGSPELLDNPALDNMFVLPHQFVTGTPIYVVDVLFEQLPGRGEVDITACVVDVKENQVCTNMVGQFNGHRMFLPGLPK